MCFISSRTVQNPQNLNKNIKVKKFCASIQHPRNGPFWEVLGSLLLTIWSKFDDVSIRVSTLACKNSVSNLFEGFEFLWKMDRPKFGIFGSTLTHDFIRRWPKSIGKTTKKIRSNPEKLQSLSYLNISKSRFYLLSLLTEKYDYFLHYLGNFWQGTGRKNQSVTIRI